MFIEFVTRKNEKVTINISMILFITPYKNGTMVIDCEGNDYESSEKYDSFIERLNNIIK